jgi:catechol 2,3-dioxygenase-like lactoylglutathione lyase family enzyme
LRGKKEGLSFVKYCAMLKGHISIRPFIGSADFNLSREFYRDLGFEEVELGPTMSVFKSTTIAFYLQSYYVKDWVDNSMIFVEVEDVDEEWKRISSLGLEEKYSGARLVGIREEDWGREFFLHDPAGILWHFGCFR